MNAEFPPGNWRRFLRRVSLKPYGDYLLTPGGDFWIFGARTIVVLMAAAEALSWAYLGSQIGRDFPWIAASIAGVFIFSVIWVVDASFITLDLSASFYERVAGSRDGASLKKTQLKFATGALARLLIVFGSLLITAPFLAQLMFSKDVESEMISYNDDLVASARTVEEKKLMSPVEKLEEEKRLLEMQRIQEVAGSGPSKRYGKGPVLATIEDQLRRKEEEILGAKRVAAEALASFDRLSKEELRRRYKIKFVEDGVQAREEVLGSLLNKPTYSRAELAVKAFLALLFVGLFILKLFQPRSIQVYFNEQLQSLHARYRLGLFDHFLESSERAAAGCRIDPLRFEDWCLTTYASVQAEDMQRRSADDKHRIHEDLVAKWQGLLSEAGKELAPIKERRNTLIEEQVELDKRITQARRRSQDVEEHQVRNQSNLKSFRRALESGELSGAAFTEAVRLVATALETEQGLSDEANKLRQSIAADVARAELLSDELKALSLDSSKKEAVVGSLVDFIDDERLRYAKRVGEFVPRRIRQGDGQVTLDLES